MSLYQEYFRKMILDLVIMNDDLCFHALTDLGSRQFTSFALPEGIIIPPTDEKELDAIVRCPVCKKQYPEASKRFKKEMIMKERCTDRLKLQDIVSKEEAVK
jgi:hypothetical protein